MSFIPVMSVCKLLNSMYITANDRRKDLKTA